MSARVAYISLGAIAHIADTRLEFMLPMRMLGVSWGLVKLEYALGAQAWFLHGMRVRPRTCGYLLVNLVEQLGQRERTSARPSRVAHMALVGFGLIMRTWVACISWYCCLKVIGPPQRMLVKR